MSMIFADSVVEERKDYSYKVPMSTVKDVEDELGVLLGYLHGMIFDNCDSKKRAEEVSQEIMTDIFVPAIKNAYQDAIEYLLWGRVPYRRQGRGSNYIPRYAPDRDYQYTDEEEENTEDED